MGSLRCLELRRTLFAQFEALDLAGRGLWQLVEKGDPARAFERRQYGLRMLFERLREILVGAGAGFDNDESFGPDQTITVRGADHRRFEHVLVHDQCRLDLGGRDIHAADLQHVVAAAAIDVIAVLILEILVAGARPYAVEGRPAAFTVIPVEGGAGRAADQEVADFAARYRPALLVDDSERVTGDRLAGRAVAHLARPVAEKNVQHLGRANAVENVDSEPCRPAPADFMRQGFAGRDAAAQREFLG